LDGGIAFVPFSETLPVGSNFVARSYQTLAQSDHGDLIEFIDGFPDLQEKAPRKPMAASFIL
jgi:hypothetical protein